MTHEGISNDDYQMSNEDNQIQKIDSSVGPLLPSQANNSSTLMAVIERISVMPELDMDRVERLFNMHERMLDRTAEVFYNAAMARAQSEMQSITVNKENVHTGSKFADIQAVHEGAKPIWTKHGFSVSSGTYPSPKDGCIGVYCEVMHEQGFKKRYEHEYPLDIAGSQGKVNKTQIQAIGSTMTYARRYMELMIFDLAVGEDNDGNDLECISPEQATEIKTKLQSTNSNVKAFLKYVNASDVDSMSIKQYEKGITLINRKVKKQCK